MWRECVGWFVCRIALHNKLIDCVNVRRSFDNQSNGVPFRTKMLSAAKRIKVSQWEKHNIDCVVEEFESPFELCSHLSQLRDIVLHSRVHS